jgi:hypothetical protein
MNLAISETKPTEEEIEKLENVPEIIELKKKLAVMKPKKNNSLIQSFSVAIKKFRIHYFLQFPSEHYVIRIPYVYLRKIRKAKIMKPIPIAQKI